VIMIPIFLFFWPSALGGDTEFLMVRGDSMLPTILSGSFIITKQAPSYEVDDIVSFALTEEGFTTVVVHRIIAEDDRGFTIQGDNNPKKDRGYYSEDDILGKVVFATPYVGDLLGLARNPIVLVFSAVAIIFVQMEQKRRRKRKEKLRRIRLGLPKPNPILEEDTKPKKPDYTLFGAALGFNVLTFIMALVLSDYGGSPDGDTVTGFLYNILNETFAIIVIFGLYLAFILGIYFLAKRYEKKFFKRKIKQSKKKSTTQLLLGKNAIPMVYVAQFLWMMFILLSIFNLISLSQDLLFWMNCNPETNLDCR